MYYIVETTQIINDKVLKDIKIFQDRKRAEMFMKETIKEKLIIHTNIEEYDSITIV